MKFYKKKGFILSALIFVLLLSLSSLANMRESDKKLRKEFKKVNKEVQIDYVNYKGKLLRYYSPNPINQSLPTVIFIHGSPGTGANYFKFLKDPDLMEKANLISLDRLGHGYSDFGNSVTSIEDQAKSIYKIIEKHNLKNVVLVSWSFGVPIAGKLSFLYPEINHNIMVAGAVSPADEKFFGISRLAHMKITSWLVPTALKVSDDEKQAHIDELLKMKNDWPKIQSTITYYHGTKDKIVPYDNMNFMKNKIPQSKLTAISVKGKGHFILFSRYVQIKNELLKSIYRFIN